MPAISVDVCSCLGRSRTAAEARSSPAANTLIISCRIAMRVAADEWLRRRPLPRPHDGRQNRARPSATLAWPPAVHGSRIECGDGAPDLRCLYHDPELLEGTRLFARALEQLPEMQETT